MLSVAWFLELHNHPLFEFRLHDVGNFLNLGYWNSLFAYIERYVCHCLEALRN